MGTFEIEVQEILARVIEVEATSSNDAISKIQEKYKKSEIVLDYNDFVEVEFIDVNTQSKDDEKDMLIREVVEYLYDDEKKHFEELDKPNNHIFSKLKRLKSLINE